MKKPALVMIVALLATFQPTYATELVERTESLSERRGGSFKNGLKQLRDHFTKGAKRTEGAIRAGEAAGEGYKAGREYFAEKKARAEKEATEKENQALRDRIRQMEREQERETVRMCRQCSRNEKSPRR